VGGCVYELGSLLLEGDGLVLKCLSRPLSGHSFRWC
jgi:hypothetical protein